MVQSLFPSNRKKAEVARELREQAKNNQGGGGGRGRGGGGRGGGIRGGGGGGMRGGGGGRGGGGMRGGGGGRGGGGMRGGGGRGGGQQALLVDVESLRRREAEELSKLQSKNNPVSKTVAQTAVY